jgi:hypothetical protein
MHCAAMCGIPTSGAEAAAREWEHCGRLKVRVLEEANQTRACYIPLGFLSDVSNMLREGEEGDGEAVTEHGVNTLLRAIEAL